MKQHAFSLSTFTASLLSFNHFLTFSSPLLINISLFSIGKSSKLKYIVVSSAYIKNLNLLLELTKSLIVILKNNGPNIEPWGIPVLISNKSDSEFSN